MPKSKSRKKKPPKRVLALPDLEHSKMAVLNSLTSASGQRTYDHAIREFVGWYCSEPRLAFNRTVVLRYRIHLEQREYAPATINLRLAAVVLRLHDGGAPESARRYTLGRNFMILLDQGGRDGTDVTLLAPPPDLAGLIEHAWVDRRSHATASDWRVVADASPHLIASVTTSGETRAMRVRLVGARSCGATVDVTGRVLCVGFRLRPGALPTVIDASAREFVDRSVAIEDVFGAGVLADLELAPDAAASLILHELIRLMRRASGQRTVRKILPDSTSPAWTVADVARWTGEATRSLRERAHREIGLSPKRTLRVLRLHSALHARRHGHSWAQVAYAAGYADQAHLTRELRALLGETPSAWQARASAVSFKTANRAIG